MKTANSIIQPFNTEQLLCRKAHLRALYDNCLKFPDDYIGADVETTSLDVPSAVIVQAGIVVVKDRIPVYEIELTLNVYDYTKNIDLNEVTERLETIRKKQAEKGKLYLFTPDYLRKNGTNPVEALQLIYNLFKHANDAGMHLVTHNGAHYDINVLESNFKRFLNCELFFDRDNIADTGMIEKALEAKLLPLNKLTLGKFNKNVYDYFNEDGPVFWNLPDACVNRYNLINKYKLDTTKAHTGLYDTQVTCKLFEEYRHILFNLE